ncbi:hypothetical protein ACFL3H_07855 [Gemmatimonadota bacterium]
MRLRYSSPLLFLLLLIGCSKADRGSGIPEGHLELVWSVQPEGAEDEELVEPWFARIDNGDVFMDNIIVNDGRRPAIIQLDHTGQFIRFIGREGDGPGEFGNRALNVSISESHRYDPRKLIHSQC